MKLKDYRLKAGLSQTQLSKAAGVPLTAITKYEQGTRDVNGMALKTAVKIAAALTQTGNIIVFAHDLLEEDTQETHKEG